MLKKIVLTIAFVILMGCSGMQRIDAGSTYPMGTTNNPNVTGLIDKARADGFKLLGLGNDITGDNVIWLETEGECRAYLLDNTNMTIDMFESCEEALEIWNGCVKDGECIDPGTKI